MEIALNDSAKDDDKMLDGRRRLRSTQASNKSDDQECTSSGQDVVLAHDSSRTQGGAPDDTAHTGKRQKMPNACQHGNGVKQQYVELSDMVRNVIADRDRLAAELHKQAVTRDECEGILASVIDQLRAAGIKHCV